jgi:hypothetical protein
MIDQIQAWLGIAAELDIEVVAPCDIRLNDGSRVLATAHVKSFGFEKGMVVDPDYDVLRPHKDALIANGYGYSAVKIGLTSDRDSVIGMLADWGWNSARPRPVWLPKLDRQISN